MPPRQIVVLCPAGHRMVIPYPLDGREASACECGFRLAVQVEF